MKNPDRTSHCLLRRLLKALHYCHTRFAVLSSYLLSERETRPESSATGFLLHTLHGCTWRPTKKNHTTRLTERTVWHNKALATAVTESVFYINMSIEVS
jgi:hypothetical protein